MSGTNATLSGPSTVAAGGTTTNYTITPFFAITGTYTPTDGGFGGTFTPPSVSWAADASAKTFVYNAPNVPALITITPVFSPTPTTVCVPPNLNLAITGTNPSQHIYYFPQAAGVPPFQVLLTNDQIPGSAVPTPAAAPQHIYYFPMQAGVPPFQVLLTNNQIPGTIPTPPVVTYTQSISPSSALVPTTAVLTYTLSGVLASNIVITPVATHGTFSPLTVTITAGSLTGTTTLSDAVVGVSTISSTNSQALTDPADITFTGLAPVTATTGGTIEAGNGSIVSIDAGSSVTLMGPIQTPVRDPIRQVFSASASGTFNLDYQFTTDGGSTWYIGDEITSSTVTADGTANTQAAHMKITTGFQFKVTITNTDAVAISAAYEHRLILKGKAGQ